MAIINTGAVERTITGVNESDLFLDESNSNVTNTGAVEREIEDSHDANFVHPLGDEMVVNGSFDSDSNWTKGTGWIIENGKASNDGSSSSVNVYLINSASTSITGKTYKVVFTISDYVQGSIRVRTGKAFSEFANSNGTFTQYQVSTDAETVRVHSRDSFIGSIDNISIKEVLVNRESTVTNTGAVERDIEASHDANFVHPLGDEMVINGDFATDSDWTKQSGWSISGGKANRSGISSNSFVGQDFNIEQGKKYIVKYDRTYISGNGTTNLFSYFDGNSTRTTKGNYNSTVQETVTVTDTFVPNHTGGLFLRVYGISDFTGSIDNISVKEVLVNRESDVTNTGVTIRDIEGINVSDEMFPDNTESSILNVGEEILPLLNNLESRSTYYENEENTINLLKNLNC